jgi:class 3 adenylate cyclase
MKKDELCALVDTLLSTADQRWRTHGRRLNKFAESRADVGVEAPPAFVPSHIPGHRVVATAKPSVSPFIAWMLDMRDSTRHMTQRIAAAKATELHRIYLETTALLPAAASIVADRGGSVTEFQGDGVLALFPFPEDQSPSDERDAAVYRAFWAAEDALDCVDTIINVALRKRYDLPGIQVGVGLALSQALVTTVGLDGHQQPAAFGQCVWRASKLSKGRGTIQVDSNLHLAWPEADDGPIRFEKRSTDHGFDAYIVSRRQSHD